MKKSWKKSGPGLLMLGLMSCTSNAEHQVLANSECPHGGAGKTACTQVKWPSAKYGTHCAWQPSFSWGGECWDPPCCLEAGKENGVGVT